MHRCRGGHLAWYGSKGLFAWETVFIHALEIRIPAAVNG